MSAYIILVFFSGLMIWGAISDIRFFILSNKLCLSVLALYPAYLVALFIDGKMPETEYILYSTGISTTLFLILLVLFARGIIGGGDVKFIPVVALWAGPQLTLPFLLITTIGGGVVALLTISFQYLKNALTDHKSSENINFSVAQSEILENRENNIPYGIGISAGGLYVAYQLFQALN